MSLLLGSHVDVPDNVVSITALDDAVQLKISLIIRRSSSLEEYIDGIVSGSNSTLTADNFVDMFTPSQADIDSVTNFAQDNNLTVHKIYTNSATIKLVGSAKDFNTAFGITLNNIVTDDRTYISYVGDILLPNELDGVVEAVLGLDNTLELTHSFAEPSTGSGIGPHLTPQQIATAYQFPSSTGYGICVGIIELGGGYTQQNLTSSFSRIGLANPTTVDISVSGGFNNPTNDIATQEVMLDMYVVGGIVPDAKLAMYFAPNTLSGFINAVNAALHDNVNAPSIISISWGALETAWGSTSRAAMDNAFLTAIALGVTVTVATGDYGSKASSGSPVYTVQYPASSPYVLACGGTTLVLNDDGTIDAEVAWNNDYGASAGGISNVYIKPVWQTISTAQQLPNNDIPVYNRAVPDVSAVGDPGTGYQYYFGTSNTFQPNGGGTSAVAPMYAGLFARINQITGSRVGFVNPALYTNHQAFNDITEGNNALYPLTQGYNTTEGWDAVTGLGTPIGTEMLTFLYRNITYPNNTYGFRPVQGVAYPRQNISITS